MKVVSKQHFNLHWLAIYEIAFKISHNADIAFKVANNQTFAQIAFTIPCFLSWLFPKKSFYKAKI